LDDRFIEPTGRGRKYVPVAIGERFAPVVAGQARVHAQKRMFVTFIRDFTGIETGRAKIKS
jgi:hypothetical protein